MRAVNFPEMAGYDPSMPYVEGPMPTPEEIQEKQRQRLFDVIGIPARYRSVEKETKVPAQADVWQGDPWCMTILGPAGTGKTWIAVRLLLSLWKDGESRDRDHPRFFDVSVAIEKIKSEFGSDDNGRTLGLLMDSRLIVLDDLGAERETDFTKDQISVILRNRYNHCLPTIITSNALNLGQLGDQRIASRLSDGIVITLSGKDRRGRKA